MKLRDIMSTDVLTLAPGQTASDGLALMRDAEVRHAVVTSGGAIVGVISERDLGGPYGGPTRKGHSVEDLMRRGATVASPAMTVPQAALLVREKRIGCLPVVDAGRLVGIVTRGDLLAALAEGRRRDRAPPHPTDIDSPTPARNALPTREKWP